MYTNRDCLVNSSEMDYEKRILVLNPNVLKPEYQESKYQLWRATGGFGCPPECVGRAVFCRCLYDGDETRFDRFNFLGILKPELIPDWAEGK